VGERPNEAAFRAAGDTAAAAVEPMPDPLESEGFKRQIVRTLVVRALTHAPVPDLGRIDAD
jgi:hypothetical protein